MQKNTKELRLDLNEGQINLFSHKKWLNSDNFCQYARNFDTTNLINSVAQNFSVSPNNLVLVNGTYHALDIIFNFFVHDGEEIVIPVPNFAFYGKFEKYRKFLFKKIRYAENCILPVAKIITVFRSKTKLVYLANPNNPLGSVATTNELEIIIKAAKQKNILVVIDEVYADYVSEKYSVISLVKKYNNLIVLRSFSKVGLSGLKLGLIITNEKLAKKIIEMRGDIYNINKASISIVDNLLNKDGKVLISYIEEVAKIRKKLIEFFKSRNISVLPGNANFVTAKFFNTSEFCENLKSRDVWVKDLSRYPDAPFWLKKYVRITVPSAKNYNQLIKVLTEVLDLAKKN